MIDETQYRQWLDFIFVNGAVDADQYDKYYNTCPDDVVELIRLTCLHCGNDLKSYSNTQINEGLYQTFSSTSDFVFAFKKCDLHYKDIVIALQSIWHLYFDIFNERCDQVLSHLDEPTENQLNTICYMLWDVTPLAYWNSDPNAEHYYAAIAGVMEKALYLSNPACVESALHGLGHIHDKSTKELIERIIEKFLKKHIKKIRPELITYANHAKIGYVQ